MLDPLRLVEMIRPKAAPYRTTDRFTVVSRIEISPSRMSPLSDSEQKGAEPMLRPSFYFKDTYSDSGAVFPAQPFKFGLEHTRASDCRTSKSNRLALRFEVAKVGARLASLCEGLFRHESPGRRNGRMSDPRSQSVRRQRKYRVGV